MKPGEKTVERNRDYKHALGEQPNRVANKWLVDHRGTDVIVHHAGFCVSGVLEAFDLYSLVVSGVLVFKGPGVWIEEG